MTERDTHFANVAKLQWKEISQKLNFLDFGFSEQQQATIDKHMERLLAQRDYDLVYHTLANTTQAMAAYCEHRPDIPENVLAIPDLNEWPPTEREQ